MSTFTQGLTWQLSAFLSSVEMGLLAVAPALDSIPSVASHVEEVSLEQVLACCLGSAHEQRVSCVFGTIALAEEEM